MTFRIRVRVAAALWLVLAGVVWNVVFDRVVVLAGRRYVRDAAMSWQRGVPIPIDLYMRPAIRRGVWLASAVALPIAAGGVAAVQLAARRYRRRYLSNSTR